MTTFLIVKNAETGELARRFFPEGTPWQEVVDCIGDGTVIDLFKSETMTATCFKDYFRYLTGRENNFLERQQLGRDGSAESVWFGSD